MRLKLYFLSVAILFLAMRCQEDAGTLGLPDSDFNGVYDVISVDTTTIAVSTVLLDSIPTSDTGSLLVGGYTDATMGKLTAEGVTQLGVGDSWEPATTALFDSLVLVAHYTGYTYGDTAQAQTYSVYRVRETMRPYNLPQYWLSEGVYSSLYADGKLYNTSTFDTYDTPLGERTLLVRPSSSDSITIKLDPALGAQLLALAKTKSATITDGTLFTEFLKGIAIRNTSLSPCVIALKTENLKLRLYYRQYNSEELEQLHHDFTFSTSQYNYSRISADRSGTPAEAITAANTEVGASATGDQAFIQSGVGMAMKLRFPYLHKMIDKDQLLMVTQAQLVFEPVKGTYSDAEPFPSSLLLYKTDKSSLPLGTLIADFATDVTLVQKASIGVNREYGTTSAYTFTITQYMQQMLSTEGNTEQGLLVMPSAAEIGAQVNKVSIAAGQTSAYRVKINVWYTRKK